MVSVLITTSDDKVVSVDFDLLTSASPVFEDLLSLPAGNSEDEDVKITLTETTAQVRRLIAVMSGAAKRKKALAGIKPGAWEALARMADKYSVDSAAQAVETHFWELCAANKSPLHAFSLATILDDRDLLGKTPAGAISELLQNENCAATKEWQNKLRDWHSRLKTYLADLLASTVPPSYMPNLHFDSGPCNSFSYLCTWCQAMHEVYKSFQGKPDFVGAVRRFTIGFGLCGRHAEAIAYEAQLLQNEYDESAPTLLVEKAGKR
ncbi:hypothetical protein JCM8097_000994 [Rhodosporidiobolus ruineniae]